MFSNIWLRKWKSLVGILLLVGVILLLCQNLKQKQSRLEKILRCQKVNQFFKTMDFLGSDDNGVLFSERWVFMMDTRLTRWLMLIQECPWEPNATAVMQYRAELGECCNASHLLVVSKENTPLGSTINLDGNKQRNMTVNYELVNLLPERVPMAGSQYSKCALIGNGGILQHSSCGKEIDRADFIIRFNLPPMNTIEDVGTKTSLVTINPSIFNQKFEDLQGRRKPFVDAIQAYADALFLIPSLSYEDHLALGYRALYTMDDFGLARRAFFLHPHYLGALDKYWKEKGLEEIRLSTGFMFTSLALEICEHITLYGFWPFTKDLSGNPLSHHYYDNILPNTQMHAMSKEFSHYLNMYAQGALRIQLGRCQ